MDLNLKYYVKQTFQSEIHRFKQKET